MKISKGKFIGTLSKTYSTDGRINLKFNPELLKDLKKTELVLIETSNYLVPFFISKIEIKHQRTAIVKFYDYNCERYIEEFIGCKVYFELNDEVMEKTNDVLGYKIIDKIEGEIGIVEEIIEIQYSLVLKVVGDGKEILIPYRDEIVVNVDDEKKIIEIIAPEGLYDINK